MTVANLIAGALGLAIAAARPGGLRAIGMLHDINCFGKMPLPIAFWHESAYRIVEAMLGPKRWSWALWVGRVRGWYIMADLEALKNAVIKGDDKTATDVTSKALKEGVDPKMILDNGLIAGMNAVGAAFKNCEMFLPEVLFSARAMKAAMEILEPKLTEAGVQPMATIIVGTVKGDVHDIGKNLVIMMLKGAGFNAIDLGTNVTPEQFVEAAKKHGAKAAGLSALLTTTMPVMGQTVTAFKRAGMNVKVMIGGASVTQHYADTIGAHGYAPDATSAVDLVKRLLSV